MNTPAKLFSCWHPVAYAHGLKEKPLACKLLDTHLVVWRGTDHAPHRTMVTASAFVRYPFQPHAL